MDRIGVLRRVVLNHATYSMTFALMGFFLGWATIMFGTLVFLPIIASYIVVLSIMRPIETNIYIIAVWGIFQGMLAQMNMGSVPLSHITVLFMIIPLCIGVYVRRKEIFEESKNTLVVIYIVWALWNMGGIFLSPNIGDAIIFYSRCLIGAIILTLFALGMKHEIERIRFTNAIIICGAISALITISQFMLFHMTGLSSIGDFVTMEYYYGDSYRPVGTFDGPVGSGIILFCIYLVSNYRYLVSKQRVYLIANVILIFGMLVTLTRTAVFALVLSVILQSVHKSIQTKKFGPILKILMVVILVGAVMITFFGDIIEKRFVDFTTASTVDQMGAGRVGIWLAVVNGLVNESDLTDLIIGNGINSAVVFVNKYSIFGEGYAHFTHNDFLDIFVSNGVISFLLLISFFVVLFKTVLDAPQLIKRAFFFPIVCYCSIVMMLSNTNYAAAQRWFFLLVIVIIIQEVQQHKKEIQNTNIRTAW